MPLIFTLAAKLEDVPLSNFVVNPTKIANSLAAIYHRLRLDGVTCYYDLFLVAEALGCQLNLSSSPPTLERPTRETALKMLQQPPGDVKQRGRLPVALEVVHRLLGTLRNGPVLVIGLPGPLRVAQQLFGQDVLRELAAGDDDALDSFETLVEITLSVAQAFCLAGAHLLYFNELDVPVEFLAGWQGPLLPPIFWFFIKVVAFLFMYIWLRTTYPRLRYDMLMRLGWKFLLPLAIANVVVTAVVLVAAT